MNTSEAIMCGIIYTAIGKEHYCEAEVSAASVKRCMDIPIAIVTDRCGVNDLFDIVIECTEEYSPAVKIETALTSPFDKTLMLDTDTYVTDEVDVFDALDHFDVAAVWLPGGSGSVTTRSVPTCFPEFNSGVLAFKKHPWLDDWLELYNKMKSSGDQGALREALFYSDARLCVLPFEYNYRFSNDACVSRMVKILHGPGDRARYETIRRRVNTHSKQRILRAVDVCHG